MNRKLCLWTAATIAGVASAASAHHSFAMFDRDKTLFLKATVKELEWHNPHSWLHVVVTNERGESLNYSFEMSSIGDSTRYGWTGNTVKPGDKITVEIHPHRTSAS